MHRNVHSIEIPFFIFIEIPLFFEDNSPEPPSPNAVSLPVTVSFDFLLSTIARCGEPCGRTAPASRRGPGSCSQASAHSPPVLWNDLAVVPSVEHWVFLPSGPGAWGRGEGA